MRQVRWWVTPVVLAAVVAGLNGCTANHQDTTSGSRSKSAAVASASSTTPQPPASSSSPGALAGNLPEPLQEALQAAVDQDARTRVALAKVARFMKKAKRVRGGHVGPTFSLEDVQYTSRTDAAAEFWNCRTHLRRVCTTVVETTDDNWSHAAGLAIPDRLADTVEFMPLGNGAVAITATEQLVGNTAYPAMVLDPDGKVALLDTTSSRPLESGDTLVNAYWNGDVSDYVGLDNGLAAADTAAGEVFTVAGAPDGMPWEDVPGRPGAVLAVAGYYRKAGAGVYRFHESTDGTHSWRQVDVRLPPGTKPLERYDDYRDAVGPGHRLAVAVADQPQDMPLLLRELLLTDDEKTFRRVPLPWKDHGFGGIAFAADGALLVAGLDGPATYCEKQVCNRHWTMWRLSPHAAKRGHFRPVPGAPPMYGQSYPDVLSNTGGGVLVARTGGRTIGISRGGYSWTKVTPGR